MAWIHDPRQLTVAAHDVLVPPGIPFVDLNFLEIPHAIATAAIISPAGVALVDPGPSSCLDALEAGLQQHGVSIADVTEILLTHIHLDHGGATGTLVRHHPGIRVFVHAQGARHLADPSKLIASASRFFGAERMQRYWAEIAPVPTDRMTILHGGERIRVANRHLVVLYTPGHASHHVTYFDESDGIAFVGDTAGLRVDGGYVLPPTPPPDIDVDAWIDSIGRITALHPHRLFITHFGPVSDVDSQFASLTRNLRTLAERVYASLQANTPDAEASESFGQFVRAELRRTSPTVPTDPYEPTAPIESLWYGLARYWRTRGTTT